MSTSRSVITNKEKRLLSKLVENELNDKTKEISKVKIKLKQVALLCRLFNKKVEITYETLDKGLLKITTKVWLTTCKNIVLKDGLSIPTNSIKEVRIL